MLKKFFGFRKKKASCNLQTDSTPTPPREIQAAPIDIPSSPPISTENVTATSNNSQQAGVSPSPEISKHGTTIKLSISNSHGFQIGDVQNITVSNGSVAHINSFPSSLPSHLAKSLVTDHLKSLPAVEENNRAQNDLIPAENKADSQDLLLSRLEAVRNDYSKIKDWQVSLISENAENDWKTLALALSLSDSDINGIGLMSGGNATKAVMESLELHLRRYPDTSIGFIAFILNEAGQRRALDKLLLTL